MLTMEKQTASNLLARQSRDGSRTRLHKTLTLFLLLLLFCCQYPDDERVVKQFHFTAWPDHGVPSHPTPLLSLVRHTFSANRESIGPMVVHCRCGEFSLS